MKLQEGFKGTGKQSEKSSFNEKSFMKKANHKVSIRTEKKQQDWAVKMALVISATVDWKNWEAGK